MVSATISPIHSPPTLDQGLSGFIENHVRFRLYAKAMTNDAPDTVLGKYTTLGLCVWLLLFAVLTMGLAIPSAYAEDTTRPKIGLALGGGGARGLAHIGVLKALEQLRIPIDYVAGTSSGAIIGGLYAAGMSPEEIELRITSIDWDDILTDRLARRDLSYRRKQDDREYLFPIDIGVRGFQLIFPRGLIAGQKVGFFLRSATLPVSGENNFDHLPIPFRAIATDLETGAPVVLRSGDLAEALQASMSVPGIFSPVEIGGRLLVDGGMSANIPVQAVLDMGADIVIAVNISAQLLSRNELDSAVDISNQALSFLSQKTNQQQLALLRPSDVTISPELLDVGAAEFERGAEIVATGATALREHQATLARYALRQEDYEYYLQMQRATLQRPSHLDAIELNKPERVSPDIIMSRLDTQPDTDLDIEVLRKDLARIYDLGDFERVDFRVVRQNELRTLQIDVKEKSWGPDYLRLGLNLIDDFEGDSRFNVLIDYTRTWVNQLGGEWKNEFSVGRTRKIFSEFYQPLDPLGVTFVAPHALHLQDTRDVYEGEHRVAQYSSKVSEIGFDTGLQLSKHGEVRVGIVREWVHAAPRVGAVTLPEYDIRQGAYVGSIVYDQVDDVAFPRNGFLASGKLFMARKALGADNEYDKASASWLTAFTYKTHTMFANAEFGTNIKEELPFYDTFTLGGFQRLSGYRTGQLSGQYLAFGRLVFYERVGKLPKAGGNGIYVGGSAEAGNVWNDRDDVAITDLRTGFSLFASAETIVGPLYFAYGLADTNEYAFYLFLGRTF